MSPNQPNNTYETLFIRLNYLFLELWNRAKISGHSQISRFCSTCVSMEQVELIKKNLPQCPQINLITSLKHFLSG